MTVEIRPFRLEDVEAHVAGEDDLIVRWHTGGISSCGGTPAGSHRAVAHRRVERRAGLTGLLRTAPRPGRCGRGETTVRHLAGRAAGGYVDHDTEVDGLEPGEVNISYSVHPWARGRGVAGRAVDLMCEHLRANGIGTRAVLRVEPENVRSVRVAQKAGFTHVGDAVDADDGVLMSRYVREL